METKIYNIKKTVKKEQVESFFKLFKFKNTDNLVSIFEKSILGNFYKVE